MEKGGAGKRTAAEAFGPGCTPQQPPPSIVYEVDIPILANSIFLNVKSSMVYDGIGYGARFVGYRTLPDGSQGPAEKQRLIRNTGDELVMVDNIDVSTEKFDNIIRLLKDVSRKYDAIRMQFRTRVMYDEYSPPEIIPHQSSQRTYYPLTSVKRDMSIEDAINAANGFRASILDVEDAMKDHDEKIKSLEDQISEWKKALEDEQQKRNLASAKKDRLTKQLLDAKELTKLDTVRVLEEIKKTIIYGENATAAKGRSFMSDMIILNDSKELLNAAQLIGISKIPVLLGGALQAVVESPSSSTYTFALRTLYQPILTEGVSTSSSAVHSDIYSIPWRYIAEAIALAGDMNDAELFVKGVLSQADEVKVSNKALISRRKYRYNSTSFQSSKCHILDMLFPSWEVAKKKFKPELAMATQTLERVLMNNLHESARNAINVPSYSMQVEADIARSEGDEELSSFLRSENFSGTFSREKNGLISLQRIINDRINDAYKMISYEIISKTGTGADSNTSTSSTTVMKVEKSGIGRPEAIEIMRDRQLNHVQILKMLMEGGPTRPFL